MIDTYSGTSTYDGMAKYAYTWAKNGDDTNQLQELKVTQSPASVTYDADYSYNNRGQLTAETRSNGGGRDFDFAYDQAGNLTRADRGNTTTHYAYDHANQLCWMGPTGGTNLVNSCPGTAPGASEVVDRDAAGNSEGDPDHPISYNTRSQAVDVDGQDQGYLDQGNDLRTTAGDTLLVNTQTGITARTTNTGTPTAETTFYTRMPDGRILSAHQPGAAPAETYYYVTDDHKSVLHLIDADGDRAGTYRYDPYGKPTLVENTTAEQNNPFRWIGGYQHNDDQPGGYIKLGARFHNPTTGAFTQPDPEPGNMGEPLRLNPYQYGGGDPINNTDPSGRFFDGVDDAVSAAYAEYSHAVTIASGIAATGVAAYGAGLALGIACTATAVVCAVAAPTLVASGAFAVYGGYKIAEGY